MNLELPVSNSAGTPSGLLMHTLDLVKKLPYTLNSTFSLNESYDVYKRYAFYDVIRASKSILT